MNLIPSRIGHLLIEESTGNQLVFIEAIEDQRRFSIAIGPLEALAIQRALVDERFPRPLTHDLMGQMMYVFGIGLREIRIVKLEQETFYAELILSGKPEGLVAIDCRPSDALALLARQGEVPLLVNEAIFDALCQ